MRFIDEPAECAIIAAERLLFRLKIYGYGVWRAAFSARAAICPAARRAYHNE